MDHAAWHRDGVSHYFVSDTELLERVNAARGERKVDRPPPNEIARARVGPPLVKIDLVSAPPEIRGEQPSGKATTDEGEFSISGHEEC
jgi:hypothetical protein